jgi:predicted DsbA family dithiol-disulfide isomerase
MTTKPLHIEIWSDFVCPFCYIGKKRFETALEQFGQKDQVTIDWKSFLLSPDMKTDPSISIHQYLSRHKHIPLEDAVKMNDHVSRMATESGLKFNMNMIIPANSFKSHLLYQIAAASGKKEKVGEALFSAYFTEGKNIDDPKVLVDIGIQCGLDPDEIVEGMNHQLGHKKIASDLQLAGEFGIQGVPFFVFNRKYAVSGAQEVQVFLEALKKIAAETENISS